MRVIRWWTTLDAVSNLSAVSRDTLPLFSVVVLHQAERSEDSIVKHLSDCVRSSLGSGLEGPSHLCPGSILMQEIRPLNITHDRGQKDRCSDSRSQRQHGVIHRTGSIMAGQQHEEHVDHAEHRE